MLPHRPRIEEDEEEDTRPFPRLELEDSDGEIEIVESMELVVSLINPKHRMMFELLAATGVRRSELIAFKVHDLSLNGGEPYVKIRRRIRRRRGMGPVVGALKSRYAKRDLPVSIEVADRLRTHIAGRSRNDWAFASATGARLDPANLANRVLAPACEEAAVEWAGFHTFRHTVASRLFAEGRNILQVQHWLGHHSPSFTLDTYVHLLDKDLGRPLEPLWVKEKPRQGPEKRRKRDSRRIHENGGLAGQKPETRKARCSDPGFITRRSQVRILPPLWPYQRPHSSLISGFDTFP